MASYHHQMSKLHQEQETRKAAAAIKDENKLFNPMNLPQNGPKPALADCKPDRDESPRGPGRRPVSGAAGGLDSPRQFSAFHDDLGTSYVNPATGII